MGALDSVYMLYPVVFSVAELLLCRFYTEA